jgi:hypothetical protein
MQRHATKDGNEVAQDGILRHLAAPFGRGEK